MKKLLIISALLCCVVSCKEFADVAKESAKNGTNASGIVFKANIGKYTVKATNTSFEENDAVAILADWPINSGFVKYVVQNGTLSSETPICWEDGDYSSPDYDPEEGVAFCLVYPYDPQLTTWDLDGQPYYEVGVNTDQSTRSQYSASDFMIGEGEGDPSGKEVYIGVNHEFSQVYFAIDNKSGKSIKDVYLADVHTKGVWNWDIDFAVSGEKGSVKAYPVQGTSTQDFVLIIPPQTTQPQLIINSTDGEQIAYTLPFEAEFAPGHKSTANVILEEDLGVLGVVDFNISISDWKVGDDLLFARDEAAEDWEYIGRGKYMDDIFASMFELRHVEMDVDYFRDRNNPKRIMVKDPYKDWPYLNELPNQFSYLEGRSIVLNIRGNGNCYIENGSSTGISVSDFYSVEGELFLASKCVENSWVNTKEKSVYLTNTYGEGCWSTYEAENSSEQRVSSIIVHTKDQAFEANYSGMTVFTLPGSVRMPAFVNSSEPTYQYAQDILEVRAGHDLTSFSAAYIPYYNFYTEGGMLNALSAGIPQIDSLKTGTSKNQLIYETAKAAGEVDYSISSPFSKTGVYQVITYGEGSYNGEDYYGVSVSKLIPFVAPGEEAPACKPQIARCNIDIMNEPTTVNLVVKCDYIYSDRIIILTKSYFDEFYADEYEIACLVYEDREEVVTGDYAKYALYGKEFSFSNLKPNTEYVVIYGAQNLFGNDGYTTASFTTGGELQFQSLGMGKFYDFSVPTASNEEYSSDVEILQEVSGLPVYRVMNPYKKLNQERPELTEDYVYNDLASEYIQFYTHEYAAGNYLFFNPFYSGLSTTYITGAPCPYYYAQQNGDIFANPENYLDTYCNKEISKGIFNIAPYIRVESTPYVADMRRVAQCIVIVLPGHDISELSASSPMQKASFAITDSKN